MSHNYYVYARFFIYLKIVKMTFVLVNKHNLFNLKTITNRQTIVVIDQLRVVQICFTVTINILFTIK